MRNWQSILMHSILLNNLRGNQNEVDDSATIAARLIGIKIASYKLYNLSEIQKYFLEIISIFFAKNLK